MGAGHIFLHRILKDLHIHRILVPKNITDRPLHVIRANCIAKARLYFHSTNFIDVRLYLLNLTAFLARMRRVISRLHRHTRFIWFPLHQPMQHQRGFMGENDTLVGKIK